MRKTFRPIRGAPPQPARAARPQLATAARVTRVAAGGGGALALLSILFWLIFYQNVPNTLEGMAASGPVISANVQDRIVKILMLAMSIYVMASRWSVTRSAAGHINVGAAAFLVLAPLSAAWSIDPSATLLRSISLANIFLVCFAITLVGSNPRRFQQVATPPLMLILLISLAVGIVLPDRITEMGTDISQKGAWHGITHSKNEFGMMSSMATIICANRWLSKEGRTYVAIAGTAVGLLCVILSRSNTSQFATMVAVLAMVLLMRVPIVRQRFSTHVVVSFAATILLYELVIQDVVPGLKILLSPIMTLTGKDGTFSARTVIWGVIKDHIQYAPYLGSGYGAYWQENPNSPSYVFVALMNFYPTESHNGYLEVVNDLGLLGLGCVLAYLIWFMRQALRLMRIDRSQAALYLGLLFQEMVMNMSESEWFSRGSTFAVLVLATSCLSRGLLNTGPSAQPVRPAVRVRRSGHHFQ